MEALLKEFDTSLGSEILKKVKEKFYKYVDAVQSRNAAVMSYSEDVQLLIRYLAETQTLEAQKRDIIRAEYDQLGMEHPTLTAFMRAMYTNALTNMQVWLKGMQQAYQFVALDNQNIIGQAMQGFVFSQFNFNMLNHIRSTLDSSYANRTAAWGRHMQSFSGIKYSIPDIEMYFQDSMTDQTIVKVPINPKAHAQIFGAERADIRVTSVRFFMDGVKTKDGFLDLWLIHSGPETIVDETSLAHDFDHQPLKTNFRYEMITKRYKGPGTVSGAISPAAEDDKHDDKYSFVGPFTTWFITVSKESNPGLDMSKASRPYLEFDIRFRGKSS